MRTDGEFNSMMERKVPRHLPVEQLRQWVISKIKEIDEARRSINERIKSAEKDSNGRLLNDGDVRAKTKGQYLKKERYFLRDLLVDLNRKIKERNVAMHSVSKNDVQLIIEMNRLLQEQHPDMYYDLRDQAETNLNIREKKTYSGYVKMIQANGVLS